ncbi:PorP/SprF family type IX secretion system membrane protein [Brumimicrobium mesophilum]|uniref:PorP/SprF family type IX secretion system membrane protein n=1 Tax=Brumimicrobium mesophilum TaxID=392717 RepID=UPI000D144AA4|nr:type IX secretion system membrane protein PorP/SprF [Brumimicrobium mesophilum]
MKRLLLISILISSAVFYTYGQQDKTLTHFIFDKMSINPGATGVGMSHQACGTMIYRNQWDKFNGAPNSVLANAEANLSQYFPSAAGISFYHDAIGYSRQNNVTLNYSYHLALANGTLGIGAAIGLNSFGMAPTWVTPDGIDTDPSLPTSTSQATLDANFGLYYMHETGWYAGISSTHLPAAEIDQLNFNTARHYYAMGGYRMDQAFGISELGLEGNGLIRTDLNFLSADINIRALWNNVMYAGLTYRTTDAIGIMAGFNWSSFTFGYSYDITTNRISSISAGTHEVMVKYCYPLPPIPITKARNPRYL